MKNIPEVPTTDVDESRTGLKNLAGWIARYKRLGVLHQDGFSPYVGELFDDGTLAEFEPSLAGYIPGQEAPDEDYELYEFSAQIQILVTEDSWVDLLFSFLEQDCQITLLEYIEDPAHVTQLSEKLDELLETLGISGLSIEDNVINVSWQEADEMIIKFLNHKKNPNIPAVPE